MVFGYFDLMEIHYMFCFVLCAIGPLPYLCVCLIYFSVLSERMENSQSANQKKRWKKKKTKKNPSNKREEKSNNNIELYMEYTVNTILAQLKLFFTLWLRVANSWHRPWPWSIEQFRIIFHADIFCNRMFFPSLIYFFSSMLLSMAWSCCILTLDFSFCFKLLLSSKIFLKLFIYVSLIDTIFLWNVRHLFEKK